MLTLFHNRQQLQQWTKWSLCVFPSKAGNTKMSYASYSELSKELKSSIKILSTPSGFDCFDP